MAWGNEELARLFSEMAELLDAHRRDRLPGPGL